MSLHLPAGRLAQAARARPWAPARPCLRLQCLVPPTRQQQERSKSIFGKLRAKMGWRSRNRLDPLMERKDEIDKKIKQRKKARADSDAKLLEQRMTGRGSGDTIFQDEIKESKKRMQADQLKGKGKGKGKGKDSEPDPYAFSNLKEHTSRALDPDPRWRVRWQRRKVMQMVRNAGKPLTKDERIKRSERELVWCSEPIGTSTKKLMFLARQVAGKTVEDALVQMRFSKKKFAKEIGYYLEEASDNATVANGMGLGRVHNEILEEPRKIQTKDGKFIQVDDPTRLYIEQAWVAKGPRRFIRPQYHARSRMSYMVSTTARLGLVLKEEKTRIRQHDDRVDKAKKAKPWVHLPNRPIIGQRQHYTW